jgi:hypothetical protein
MQPGRIVGLDVGRCLALLVLVLLWIAALFVALDRRGPLESVVRWASEFATSVVRSRQRS